ncbi:T9SS C-terminal target domain-containing protein [Barnesiella sp. ET7]|uniref:T9SS C-terminal target domain-containing protein n=1 Tax=Barnesiella sp. ET7 TaxID=2972460 RepID=UPI0021AD0401|nr:T9SS C-terminal target domain-containing protein [Barnesiella sp. ET7]MCR8912870.1 T9SS C-terminal target domain-containing protein [Barnesiella sp. ET7]
MKNLFYKGLATICSSIVLTSSLYAQENLYAGGSGTKSDPYIIETPAQFDAIRENRSAYFKLNANLDFENYEKEGGWWPLGEWGAGDGDAQRFSGTFDGNGFTISNLLAKHGDDIGAHDMSVFGVVDGGTIKNVIFDNITVIGGGRLGIVSGQTRNASYEQIGVINSTCSNIQTGSNAGGITGPSAGTTTIINCYTQDCTIEAESPHEEGAEWTGDAVGGIVSSGNATIMNCYSTSTVKGKTNIGGIIGSCDGATVVNCLALNPDIIGEVEVSHRIVGKRNGGDVSDNYAHSSVKINGNEVVENTGLSSDNGETVTDLTADFYQDYLYFDFDEVWKLDSSISQYPVFKWQEGTGAAVKGLEYNSYKIYTTDSGIKIENLEGNEHIAIYSIAGCKLVDTNAAEQCEFTLDNHNIYIVSITNSNSREVYKVIK